MIESNNDNNSSNGRSDTKVSEDGSDMKTRGSSQRRSKSNTNTNVNANLNSKNDGNNDSNHSNGVIGYVSNSNSTASSSPRSASYPPRTKVIEPHAKNFTGWEVTSVELSALRDIIPRIRHEIRAYTISECQYVRELERKLPATRSSGEVRLHLVMEQIERLRMHRRNALDELSRSNVRIAELESKKERASYDAGELYWNTRINELENKYYAGITAPIAIGAGSSISSTSIRSDDALMQPRTSSIPRPSFYTPTPEHSGYGKREAFDSFTMEDDAAKGTFKKDERGNIQGRSSTTAFADTSSGVQLNDAKNSSQYDNQARQRHHHELTNLSRSPIPSQIKNDLGNLPSGQMVENPALNLSVGNKSGQVQTDDPVVSSAPSNPTNQAAIDYLGEILKGKASSFGQETGQASEDAEKNSIQSPSDKDDSEIDMIISEAQEQINQDKRKLKKLIWKFGAAIAVVLGLIVIESQTGIFSGMIANLAR